MNKNIRWKLITIVAVLVIFAGVGVYPILAEAYHLPSPGWLQQKQLKLGRGGLLSVRRKQFPFRPKPGSWTIQFDQDQAYNPAPTQFTRLPVKVSRGPRD